MSLSDRIDTDIRSCLVRVFGNVETEWRANKIMPNVVKQDDLRVIRYCPRIDFAVGPFNTDKNHVRLRINKNAIRDMYRTYQSLVDQLVNRERVIEMQWWNNNISDPDMNRDHELSQFEFNERTNENPRCFMAIEVEKTPGQKHRMGSIMNVAALGKVGVIVAKGAAYRHLVRIRLYFRFLLAVEKPGVPISNVLILPKNDFVGILNHFPIS